MQRRLPWVCHQCSLRQSSWCRRWWTSWLWCQTPLLFLCGTWSGRRNCERTQTHHRQNSGGRWRDELDLVNHEVHRGNKTPQQPDTFFRELLRRRGTLEALYVQTDALFSQHTDGDTNPAETQHKDNTSRWRPSYSLTYASPKCPLLHRNASLPWQCQTQSDILSFDWTKLKCKIAVLKPIRCKMHPFAFSDSLYVFDSNYATSVFRWCPTPPDPTRPDPPRWTHTFLSFSSIPFMVSMARFAASWVSKWTKP